MPTSGSHSKIGFGVISPETNKVETFATSSQYSASSAEEVSPVPSLLPELNGDEEDRSTSEHSAGHRFHLGHSVEPTALTQSHSPKHSDSTTPGTMFAGRLPRLSRSISMPASSHLSHLRRPERKGDTISLSSYQQEVSNELADTVQAVVQMLLHISPPHLLDPVKEQFSTCTIQIPTPSVFSLITTMKNLNYISANLPSFAPLSEMDEVLASSSIGRASDTFDIGEVVQSVADVLGGLAAQNQIDLVLFHGDVGMKHINVVGDECCILFILTHVVRQIVNSAKPGDAIELGLHLALNSSTAPMREDPLASSAPGAIISPSILEEGALLSCTFDISHKLAPIVDKANIVPRHPPKLDSVFLRRLMKRVGAKLTASARPTTALVPDTSYELSIQLTRGPSPTPDPTPLSLSLEDDEPNGTPSSLPTNLPFAKEPTLEELAVFAETSLKGKKVLFHASETSTFARYLTSYLTSWGLDVVHVPMGMEWSDEIPQAAQSKPVRAADLGFASTTATSLHTANESVTSPAPVSAVPDTVASEASTPGETPESAPHIEPSFVIIDDDVDVLRRRLNRFRPDVINSLHFSKRPSLSSYHRPRSSPQVRQLLSASTPLVSTSDASSVSSKLTVGRAPKQPAPLGEAPATSTSTVIVHITSLANYKLVKDTVQSALFLVPPQLIPDIIVIPKPAGPRRFLTALHTAFRKSFVDPYFFPIATSPQSPGGLGGLMNPSYSIRDSIRSPHGRRTGPNQPGSAGPSSPTNARGNGQGTSSQVASPPVEWGPVSLNPLNGSPREGVVIGPTSQSAGTPGSAMSSSPLSESLGYFSTAAAKFGSSAAKGLVLQSPDGRPAGIYFQPQRASTTSSVLPQPPPVERPQRERSSTSATRSRNNTERERRMSTDVNPSASKRTSSGSANTKALEDRALKPPRTQTPDQIHRSGEEEVPSTTPTTTGFPRRGTRSRPSSSHSRPTSSQGRTPSESATVVPSSPYGPPSALPHGASSRRPLLNPDDDAPLGVVPRRRSFRSTGSDNNNPPPRRSSPPPTGKTLERERPLRVPLSKADENADPDSDQRNPPERSPLPVLSPPVIQTTLKSPNLAGLAARVKRSSKSMRRSSSQAKTRNAPTPKHKTHAITPPISVLIVEDNPINQTILTTWMRRKKLKYATANNGAEAVEKWRTGQFHLILMDIQMPVMDGIDATKEIRRLERVAATELSLSTPSKDGRPLSDSGSSYTPSTPFHSSVIIVALTASSLQSDRVMALAAGCNDFLTKPVSLHWLDKKIIEWGSIKALQLWANSDQARDLQFGQEAKARSIELRLPGTDLRSAARKRGEDVLGTGDPVPGPSSPQLDKPNQRSDAILVRSTSFASQLPGSSDEGRHQHSASLQDIIERPDVPRKRDVAILGQNALPEVLPSIRTVLQSSESPKPPIKECVLSFADPREGCSSSPALRNTEEGTT